jgi:hypothetical protein
VSACPEMYTVQPRRHRGRDLSACPPPLITGDQTQTFPHAEQAFQPCAGATLVPILRRCQQALGTHQSHHLEASHKTARSTKARNIITSDVAALEARCVRTDDRQSRGKTGEAGQQHTWGPASTVFLSIYSSVLNNRVGVTARGLSFDNRMAKPAELRCPRCGTWGCRASGTEMRGRRRCGGRDAGALLDACARRRASKPPVRRP